VSAKKHLSKPRKKNEPPVQRVMFQLPSGEDFLGDVMDIYSGEVVVAVRADEFSADPASHLPKVRFFVDSLCTFRGHGEIHSILPSEDEENLYTVRLEVFLAGAEKRTSASQTYRQEVVIRDVLRNLSTISAPILVKTQLGEERAQSQGMVTAYDLEKKSFSVSLRQMSKQFKAGVECLIDAEIYGTRMAFDATIHRRRGYDLELRFPTFLQLWDARQSSRLRLPPAQIKVEFESPLTREVCTREVVDVSSSGVAFLADPSDGLISGMTLRTLGLGLPGKPVSGRGVVRHVREDPQHGIYIGAQFVALLAEQLQVLSDYVDQHIHPQVRTAKVSDLEALWDVYNAMGHFERQFAALTPLISRMETNRKILLNRGKGLFIQLVGYDDENSIFGTAEAIRDYEGTWTLQHAGTAPNPPLPAERLIAPLIERLLRDPTFAHLRCLMPATSEAGWFRQLAVVNADPESLSMQERVLLSPNIEYEPRSPGDVYGAKKDDDLDWVLTRLNARHSPVERSALKLETSGGLRVKRSSPAFQEIGLVHRRLIRIAMSVTGPIGFSIVEQSSPGHNLSGYADLVRMYALTNKADERSEVLHALADDAVRLQQESARGGPYFLLEPQDATLLNKFGYDYRGHFVEIIASRPGVSRLTNFINLF